MTRSPGWAFCLLLLVMFTIIWGANRDERSSTSRNVSAGGSLRQAMNITNFRPAITIGGAAFNSGAARSQPPNFESFANLSVTSMSIHLTDGDRILKGSDSRIVRGKTANIISFPYQVLLSVRRPDSADPFICGGTLIDLEHVLTGAHCVIGSDLRPLNLSQIAVYVGNNQYGRGKMVSIAQIWSHSGFNFNYENDVAVLKLQNPLAITTHIAPIKLAVDDSTAIVEGVDLTISGWGTTSYLGTPSSVLLSAVVDMLPSGCANYKAPNYTQFNPNLQICAGCARGFVDSCQGDSGGPATVRSASGGCPILVGITSFGEGCAVTGFPGGYTRVVEYIDWIEQQTGRTFRSQYALNPTTGCDMCTPSPTQNVCGSLSPSFASSRCLIEGYLASAFKLMLKPCALRGRDVNGPRARPNGHISSSSNNMSGINVGLSLPLEASFSPGALGRVGYRPQGKVFFMRSLKAGKSVVAVAAENLTIHTALEAPVEIREGTFQGSTWRYLWPADVGYPSRTCSKTYVYAAVFIHLEANPLIQVSANVQVL